MTQYQNQNKSGTGDGFLDWAVVIAALVLFTKTADLLAWFSPKILDEIVGMQVGWLMGFVNAFLVEGIALALHFNRKAKKSTAAQISKWFFLGVSAICQVYDGKISTESISGMSEPMKMGFEYFVPLIPLFVVVMIFFIGHLPEENEYRPFRGVKHMLPDLKKLWDAEKYGTYPVQTNIVGQIEQLSTPEQMPTRADEVGDNATGNFQKGKA